MNARIADLSYEEINFLSDDEKEVHCILFKPDKEVLATIFFLQGSGDNIASWSTYAEYLVKEGYQVFMMEYRGFGADSGKATHKNVLNDAENALIKLTNNKTVKGGKLIILGQSYGGQIAINLTAKQPDKVSALIVEGTFTSFNEEVVYHVPVILKPFLIVLASSPYKSKNLINKIQGIPLLIIHSKEDTTVPIRMGYKLYSIANEPKFFWEINGEHIHGLEDYTKEYVDYINMVLSKSSNIE